MAEHNEVCDSITLYPSKGVAFDYSDPELVNTYNNLLDLREAIGQAKGNVFGWLRLPVMLKQRGKLEKQVLELEIRDYNRTRYTSGSHG